MRVRQLPTVSVLTVVVAGLLLSVAVDGLLGGLVVGLAMLLAGGLRLTLPARRAGWLVVRSRGMDATVSLLLGVGLVVLSQSLQER